MNVRIAPGAAIPLRFAEGDRSDPIAFSGQRGGRQNLLLAGNGGCATLEQWLY
jgi:hypothetical protein